MSLASGVGVSLSPAAVAAPPVEPPASSPSVRSEPAPASDELVSPLERKRRELREKAVSDVLSGRAKPQQRNGSTVVKVGQAAGGGAFGGESRTRRGGRDNRDQYVELAREKPTGSS
jgi:immune inhibitor A